MVSRLVLGCGTHVRSVVRTLADWPGDLAVVDADERRFESFRDEGIEATLGDPTDPASYPAGVAPETVVVAGGSAADNHAALAAAREQFPAACVVAYAGDSSTADDRSAMAELADQLVAPGPAIAATLLETVESRTGGKLWELMKRLRKIDGRLGVFMHDNPDPDAIASAIALKSIAESAGVPADACYFGEISHQENRAFVNLLELDLERLDADEPINYAAVALVDHSRPGMNDQLPPTTPVDIVIDHHPPRDAIDATFVDLRSDVGATSTLLADYFRRAGIAPSRTVATALLYGVRVDTRDFSREVAGEDFVAAAFLSKYADAGLLDRIESPSMAATTLDTIAAAVRNRERRGPVLVSSVGQLADRDALSQAADRLLAIEGVTTTLVYGYTEGIVYASARSRGSDLDIGEAMRQAFDQIGSAGGHDDMAGAQLPIGILGDVQGDAEASLAAAVEAVITNRFFEVVRPPDDDPPRVGRDESGGASG